MYNNFPVSFRFVSFRVVLEFCQPFEGDVVVCRTSDDRNNSINTFDVSHENTVVRPWANNCDARDDRHRAVHFPGLGALQMLRLMGMHPQWIYVREQHEGGYTAGRKDGALNPIRISGCGNECE